MRTNLSNQPQNQPPRSRDRGYHARYSREFAPHFQRSPRVTVTRVTVELTDNSVRIRFPDKPTPEQLHYLKTVGGFWWARSGFWYNRRTDTNEAFAREIEQNGFPPDLAADCPAPEMEADAMAADI